MSNASQILSQKSLVVIFAYAPTGLGHLRVTEALYRGLPEEANPVLLRSQDGSASFWHYLTSSLPFGVNILEWSQKGLTQEIFTRIYTRVLRSQTKILYQQMCTILDERVDLPKTVLVVATHFGLAHQLAVIKAQLENDKYVKIILVVQITDDTTQHIWLVPGADLTFVPSEKTKNALSTYAQSLGYKNFPFEVLPYPVSPAIADFLSDDEFQAKVNQLNPASKQTTHVAIPISGAAVGMNFITNLIDNLTHLSDRFKFHVITRSSSHTQEFMASMLKRPLVEIEASPSSREIVAKYEKLYQHSLISLELTKPSEQAFKALFSPKERGGSILLLAKPIGLQEFDNLHFLQRHHLVPNNKETKLLWEKASHQTKLTAEKQTEILSKASYWRALLLPEDALAATNFIWWCLQENIFYTMVSKYQSPKDLKQSPELGSDGVRLFWQKAAELVQAS